MKQGFNIFKFEYGAYLKSKAFVIITILLMLVVGVGLSIPRIIQQVYNMFTRGNSSIISSTLIKIWVYLFGEKE